MLNQLFSVRLKAAENALKHGRLDEAYRLATAPDLRDHHRAGVILVSLTERFIERARAHFRAERFAEALVDLDRAEAGGTLKDEIAELRAHVRTVEAEHYRKEQSRQERLDAAKRRIEGGSLAAGRRVLEQASHNDPVAGRLREQVDDRVREVQAALDLVESLMGQEQWAAAAERVRRVKKVDAHDQRVARAETTLCKKVLENAHRALLEGRIGRAEDELACLGNLGDALPAKRELADSLALVRRAAQGVNAHAYTDARRHLLSLGRRLPQAVWVSTMVENLRNLEDLRTELAAGPLGEWAASDAVRLDHPFEVPEPSLDDTVALPGRIGSMEAAPDRLLLLVDGGGSYLILRGAQVSIGRAATNNPPDVPVFSDLAERHANVSRVDDDYFLFGSKDVEVGGRPTRHELLRDGQRIVLGRKAKFTFRVPSRTSPTAVLELSDTTKMPNDVRRIVMFSRHAVIGTGPAAHIPCRLASVPLILFDRGGSFWIRPKNDGHVDTEARPLNLGEPLEMAGVSLTLTSWSVRTPGATL